jgi:hypothetical protein
MTTKHKEVIDFYADQLEKGYKRKEYSMQLAARDENRTPPKPHGFGEVSARELAEKLIAWFADGCPK